MLKSQLKAKKENILGSFWQKAVDKQNSLVPPVATGMVKWLLSPPAIGAWASVDNEHSLTSIH